MGQEPALVSLKTKRSVMPDMRIETFGDPTPVVRRYKVIATGEIGTMVGKNGLPAGPRMVRVGSSDNVNIIDFCDDVTGEIRTFRLDKLEAITV